MEQGSSQDSTKQGWTANRNDRQALLQRKREEMILQARRKLVEKQKVDKGKQPAK
jgi:coupling of ubiquitin conjugation to ER degradation protein 1